MIRTGIGGWTYPGWRGGVFYPDKLRQADELDYASRTLSAIEINGTYYRLQKPQTFAKWRAAVPDGFVFAIKGSRAVVNRRKLADAGESVGRFLDQGIAELGDALGPVLWQLGKRKRFDADDIEAFFAMLPVRIDGLPLRHVVEVNHDSFACTEFVELARRHGVAIAWIDAPDAPCIADRTADFAYARMKCARTDCPTGYAPGELSKVAAMARAWDRGAVPDGHAPLTCAAPSRATDVFVFFINGAKEKAPAAAMALAKRI